MALTDLEIANQALVRLGASTIESFVENTAEAKTASIFLEPITKMLLSAHPWGFATAQSTLGAAETDPIADYSYAFDLPADFLRVISAGTGIKGRGLDYRVYQKTLHTNYEDVVLTYIFQPNYEDFPPFFDQLIVARLAAELCIPITESTTRTKTLFEMAEQELRQAKLIDAQQDTPISVQDFALINARD